MCLHLELSQYVDSRVVVAALVHYVMAHVPSSMDNLSIK